MSAGLDSLQLSIDLQQTVFCDRELLRQLRARRELTRGQGFCYPVQFLLEREAFLQRPDVPGVFKRLWPF